MFNRFINLYRKIFWSDKKFAKYIGVKIGKNCHIATRNFGTEPYLIEIGNNVQVTNDVKFFNHGGGWVLREKYPNFDTFGKIKIGNNVYIGNNSLILPGVEIGNNVVVGAGSIVSKSIPDNSVVAGCPAKVLSNIEEYEQKLLKYNIDSKSLNYDAKKDLLMSLPDEKFIKK